MLPQGSVPPEAEPVVSTPARECGVGNAAPRHRWSLRIRILIFAVVVGGLLSIALSLVTSTLIYATSSLSVFDRERLFLPYFLRNVATDAPVLMLLAGLAAMAETLLKRAARTSRQNAAYLAEAIRRLESGANMAESDAHVTLPRLSRTEPPPSSKG